MRTASHGTTIPIYFLLRKNVLAVDLAGPAEVLRYANRHREKANLPPLFDLRYVSAEARIEMSIGLAVTGYGGLPERLEDNAIVMLIGCSGRDDDFESPEARAVLAWMRDHLTPAHRLVGICTGTLLAGHAGRLNGLQCTTHHSHCDDLRRIAPAAHVLENRLFVQDGNVYTSAGVTAGIDLTLHLLAGIAGHPCTAAVARDMVIYMRRTGTDPQLSPWVAHRNHLHPAIHRVQDAVIADPARDWSLEQLAHIACLSERHLSRLFREHAGTGIVDYLQRIRIALARDLLMQSHLDMERIAQRAGFQSGRQLRRVWRKFEAAPPSVSRAGARLVASDTA